MRDHDSIALGKQPVSKGVQPLLFAFLTPNIIDLVCPMAAVEMLLANPQRRFDPASGKKATLHFLHS